MNVSATVFWATLKSHMACRWRHCLLDTPRKKKVGHCQNLWLWMIELLCHFKFFTRGKLDIEILPRFRCFLQIVLKMSQNFCKKSLTLNQILKWNISIKFLSTFLSKDYFFVIHCDNTFRYKIGVVGTGVQWFTPLTHTLFQKLH